MTETEKDSKIKLCVYQVIDSRLAKGVFDLTPELTEQLIEGKLYRLKQQIKANRKIFSEL